MGFEELDPEIQRKIKACKTEEELRSLAKAVGLPLADAQLDSVAGGIECTDVQCLGVNCGSFSPCLDKSPSCKGYQQPLSCKIKH